MLLPGRLRSSTLGDLLGLLHRAEVTGTLELAEERGRTHRVHLARGLVAAVEVDGESPSLGEILRRDRAADDDVIRRALLRAMASRRLHGEVLVQDFRVSPSVVGEALRRQITARLTALDRLADARVSFRVAVRPPRGATPLQPCDFLHGRRRARERGTAQSVPVGSLAAWCVLGLAPGAAPASIKRAYRQLARTVHPDMHPDADDDERRSLQARFVEITEAYQKVI